MVNLIKSLVLCLLAAALLAGQSISSSVKGTVVDATGALIPDAACTLTEQRTATVYRAKSGADGSFTIPNVLAGAYTLVVEAAGMKKLSVRDINVTAAETRTLGNLALQIGDVVESVSVDAQTAAVEVQVASGEKSGIVTGAQLNNIALKGRDFMALLQTIPGVVDTNTTRETTTNTANRGTYINGGRENQKNYSIDGIMSMDSGSNESVMFAPNMDSIAEVRVLTSNYQAEYGRNAGAGVTVITKSGSRDFHGSAYNYYRHENLNANNFFNNRTATPKAPYRYRISGYSIGGPIFVPGKFNTDRNKLFFFWSQEYTGVKRDFGTQLVNVPTMLERGGDFSQSRDLNGAPIIVRDPLTGQAFPDNRVPTSRITSLGQNILNFFPEPNFTDPDPRNLYRWNYRSTYSGSAPRRNDMLRIDTNVTDTLRVFYRYGKDKDEKNLPWGDWKTGSINYLLSPVFVNNPGFGHVFHATKTFSPTLVNETSFAYSKVLRDFDFVDPSLVDRSRMGNPAQWFPNTGSEDYIPNVAFGGIPANPIGAQLSAAIPNHYENPVFAVTNNLSKVWNAHNFKAGFYLERARIRHVNNVNYRGSFNFSRDVNNPFDSNHAFANALLGNFSSYSEASANPPGDFKVSNFEWYVQDNWRVHRRLTLDLGMRIYHMLPMTDANHNVSTFDPNLYNRATAPVLYIPGINPSGQRVAMDPRTGEFAIAPLIGQYVPGSGSFANGVATGGVDGYPAELATRPSVALGPRFGFAYDLSGNGRSALRGGFGWSHDTVQTNPIRNSLGNPPVVYSPSLSYGNLGSYAQASGAIGPSSLTSIVGHHKMPNTMSYSLGIQHQVWNTLLDVSYVGSLMRNMLVVRNINPIPIGARFDAAYRDPTRNSPLPDNFMRPYYGWGDINMYEPVGTANYNALQISANRRYAHGLQFGFAYTFSKALGVASSDYDGISPYFSPRERNYGPMSYDRTHVFVANYSYEVPKIGSAMGFRPAAWVFDNWQVSGMTTFTTGAPITPSFSTTDGQDITGSTEGARINVVGDPSLPKSERDFYRNFNTAAFARPAQGTFGNAGIGILRGPGINNWDLAVTKRVPIFSEGRYVQFRTELFNAFNHTQFSGLFTGARFDAQGNQVDPNFGAYNAARPPRIIQLSLRVVF